MADSNELEVFFPDGKFKTNNGETIDIPKLSWKSEAKAVKLLGKIFNEVPAIKQVDLKNFSGKDLLAIFPAVMEKVPDYVTELVSLILKKDAAFVEDKLTAADIVEILVPFSRRLIGTISKLTKSLPHAEEPVPPTIPAPLPPS